MTKARWIWGASGRSDMARALQTSELQSELPGARAAVLERRDNSVPLNPRNLRATFERAAQTPPAER